MFKRGVPTELIIAALIMVAISAGLLAHARMGNRKSPEHVRGLTKAEGRPVSKTNESSATNERAARSTIPRGFKLVAVGDIMLDRGVGKKIAELGADFPYEHVAGILREADLTFGNLETPVSSQGEAERDKEVTFRSELKVVDGLRNAGIDVVSLANNHAMDYGPSALMETLDVLAHNGIPYAGAGVDSAAAHRPVNFTINGVNVSLLAYTYKFHKVVEAQQESPGVAIAPGEEIRTDIEGAKRWADVVIVSFHWGWEYSDHPDEETRELSHFVVESGADLVIGHHPHVIQGVELYKGSLICYSLGNFIFDQRGNRTRRGLILRCNMDKYGVQQAELLPILIDKSEFRPGLASGEIAISILSELKKLSRQLDTDIDIDNKSAIVVRKEAMLVGT